MYKIQSDITKKIHKVLSDNKAKDIIKISLEKNLITIKTQNNFC